MRSSQKEIRGYEMWDNVRYKLYASYLIFRFRWSDNDHNYRDRMVYLRHVASWISYHVCWWYKFIFINNVPKFWISMLEDFSMQPEGSLWWTFHIEDNHNHSISPTVLELKRHQDTTEDTTVIARKAVRVIYQHIPWCNTHLLRMYKIISCSVATHGCLASIK